MTTKISSFFNNTMYAANPSYVNRQSTNSNQGLSKDKSEQTLRVDSFSKKTIDLLHYRAHKTKLLRTAQDYLGNIVEVTPEEYQKLSPKDRQNTQMAFIGNHGTINEAWCAHTVSFICKKAGVSIGEHKKAVDQFICFGKQNNIYHPIQKNPICSINYIQEREQRAKQIKEQFNHLKEGDLIIWKESKNFSITQQGSNYSKTSHIGFFEGVNPDGTISVLEGNANEFKTGKYEKYIATNSEEAKNGNQQIGEPQEINPRDGFIRKTYTAEQLAAGGYSGYIDMQKLIN